MRLTQLLVGGYLLFAVLPRSGPRRRVLKFSYGEDFDPARNDFAAERPRGRLLRWLRFPDGHRFAIDCSMASWARSFHLELAIPEELRARFAMLFTLDGTRVEEVGIADENVNRVSLYAPGSEVLDMGLNAYVELGPERSGQILQGLAVGLLVTATALAGGSFHLDSDASDAAVSVLLVGAAFFSGVRASVAKHILVGKIFAGPRKAILTVALCAVACSVSLTLDIGQDARSTAWLALGFIASIATARLALSAVRAAR